MLHVALAGDLAEHLAVFRRTPIRTNTSFYRLDDPDVNPARLDLVVYLAGDLTSRKRPAGLPPVAAPPWKEVPADEPALGLAIQDSLLDVYGFVVGYTEAMHRACQWVRVLTHPAGAPLRLPVSKAIRKRRTAITYRRDRKIGR
jgi:hypothetical protein